MTEAGGEDAIAWLMAMPDGTPSHWHQTFAVADRDAAVATGRAPRSDRAQLLGHAVDQGRRAARPQGAELAVSEFTPPG